MPTHGYGPLRRFLLGSVTPKVVHDAPYVRKLTSHDGGEHFMPVVLVGDLSSAVQSHE